MKITVTFEAEAVDAASYINRLAQDGRNAHHLKAAAINPDRKHSAQFNSSATRLQDFKVWADPKAPQGSGISKIDYKET